MKFGYMKPSSGRRGLSAQHVESHAGSLRASDVEYRLTEDEILMDGIKAKAASALSHLTFG